MTERLVHFSREPLGKIVSVEQPASGLAFKPAGLWFSVEGNDDGWRQWCEGERFNLDALAVETEIVLDPNARMLRISDAEGIDQFTAEFRRPNERPFSYHEIDWRAVAAQWQGIIIAPYIWSRRRHDGSNWYYTWDCASGCIWDAAAIAELRAEAPSDA